MIYLGNTDIRTKIKNIADKELPLNKEEQEFAKLGLEKIDTPYSPDMKCRAWAMTQIDLPEYATREAAYRDFHFALARNEVPQLKITEKLENNLLIAYLSYPDGSLDFIRTAKNLDEAFDKVDNSERNFSEPFYAHFGIIRKIENRFYVDSKWGGEQVYRNPFKFDFYSTHADLFERVNTKV